MLPLTDPAPSLPERPALEHPALRRWTADPAGCLLLIGQPSVAEQIGDALAEADLSHLRLTSVVAAKLVLAGRGSCLLAWDALVLTGPTSTAASWRRLAHVARRRWERHRDTVIVLEPTHHENAVRRARLALGRSLYDLVTTYGSLIDLGGAR